MNLAIVGAGWAGLAAAVRAVQAGHQVTLFESARNAGGRARTVTVRTPDGIEHILDNGQHILIGAYTETLRLMRLVGVEPEAVLRQQPLELTYPDGSGLKLPDWPSPWDAVAGIVLASGWRWRDRLALLLRAAAWQRQGFRCAPDRSVAQLCERLSPAVVSGFIEPLCVSALNTPASRASGQVFLRVLKDAMFGVSGGSRLLLPKVPLGQLFPEPALVWLGDRGCRLRLGERVTQLQPLEAGWQLNGTAFDHVVLATASRDAVRLLSDCASTAPRATAQALQGWTTVAAPLQFEAITTVYAAGQRLSRPMLSLHTSAAHPAQFVFDRGQLGGPGGLLAFVVSASQGDRAELQSQVVRQASDQLGQNVIALQTVVEKRATFACTPQLQRPSQHIAPGLSACGDYVDGPYPATLEGAVRSGWAVGAPEAPNPIQASAPGQLNQNAHRAPAGP